MSKKVIHASATNMLCIMSSCSIVQPFSLQPALQIVVSLEEYVSLIKMICDSHSLQYNTIFSLSQYHRAVDKYESGDFSNVLVLFSFEMIQACCMELKKAFSRRKSATVISMDYGDYNYYSLDDMPSMLDDEFQKTNNRLCFNRAIDALNREYNTVPIDYGSLNEHNRMYYSYLLILRYRLAYAAEGHKFVPFNLNT